MTEPIDKWLRGGPLGARKMMVSTDTLSGVRVRLTENRYARSGPQRFVVGIGMGPTLLEACADALNDAMSRL